jgi:hypothetical protein
MTESERALLFAMRNTIDALLMGVGAPVAPQPCAHDEVELGPTSTLGNPQYQCVRCKQAVTLDQAT